MTDPLNYEYEYVRRGEALGGAAWGWLGIGAAVLIGLLVIVNYSNPTDTASTSNAASNNAPNATSNSPPRIPPSTPGSGAQPEQPTQFNPGGPAR